MDAQWFFTKNGRDRIGPFSASQLAQLAAHGLLLPTDMTWQVGTPKWVPAASAGYSSPAWPANSTTTSAGGPVSSVAEAVAALRSAWPHFVDECLAVLGSELHYQAMLYHCLRAHGRVPREQLAMNVKMMVHDPITEVFIEWTEKRAEGYQGGFEPVPDVVIFAPEIKGDWRRRRCAHTAPAESAHIHILAELELKASERKNGRITPGEIHHDVVKLASHREEVALMYKESGLPAIQPYQAVVIVDTAPERTERMTETALTQVRNEAKSMGVAFFYIAPDQTEDDFQGGSWAD